MCKILVRGIREKGRSGEVEKWRSGEGKNSKFQGSVQ
jgi:hypothetical protein